ncbi:MAG: protein kinase [Sandaracinus sp.]|nr:protein kinase [Sandaracinus sp.]MCB9636029.1 protein kinase [Sandaracinus sp.]
MIGSSSAIRDDWSPRYDAARLIVADDHGELRAAWDRRLHRGVVLRTALHPALDERLRRDAELVRRARSSALPEILDVTQDDGRTVVVLPPAQGRSLRALLDGDEPRSPAEVVSWIEQLAEAVQVLHAAGTYGVGIRPEHVLVLDGEPPRRLCLVGLGGLGGPVLEPLASLDPRAWRYAPPEFVRGARPEARTDVYALGVLAHEILHGRPPPHTYEGPDCGLETIDEVDVLGAFFRRALALEPFARFRSVAELLTAWRVMAPERHAEAWLSRIPLQLGQTFDRYRLLERLGRGGFGEVFRARVDHLDREVVVKVHTPDVRDATITDDDVRRRLVRVKSPHVARVLDTATHQGRSFVVLEMLHGKNVGEWLRERERADLDEGLRIVRDVARALTALHAEGLVHTDVKPANVMLVEGRGAVLIDFDLMQPREVLARETGRLLGTPGYLAPERLLGRIEADLAPRIDLYALGVLAFELFTGRLPFAGATPSALARQHLTAQPASLVEHRPDAPEALVQLVHSLLARDPRSRPSSAVETLARLSELS